MNFKGNAFSAGAGKITDSRQGGGKIYFLQKDGSSSDYRSFDPATKSFSTVKKGISYADTCFFYGEGGILELFGTRFVAAEI